MNTTLDVFLDGRIQITQPTQGYRAATDPVFLAASIPAAAGQSVLDVGCGVGTASICLSTRVKGVALTGIEMQKVYAQMAIENAARNNTKMKVENADLSQLSAEFRQQSFDHVMTNPPFFEPATLSVPQSQSKMIAHVETMNLENWIAQSLRRLKPKGSFTIIHLATRLSEILHAMDGPCGDLRVQPIAPRSGRAAKRVIVQGTKTAKAPLQLLAPFIVHSGKSHVKDGDDYSEEAREILRNGGPLVL